VAVSDSAETMESPAAWVAARPLHAVRLCVFHGCVARKRWSYIQISCPKDSMNQVLAAETSVIVMLTIAHRVSLRNYG